MRVWQIETEMYKLVGDSPVTFEWMQVCILLFLVYKCLFLAH